MPSDNLPPANDSTDGDWKGDDRTMAGAIPAKPADSDWKGDDRTIGGAPASPLTSGGGEDHTPAARGARNGHRAQPAPEAAGKIRFRCPLTPGFATW